jgi:hypothetical protein
VHSQAIPTPETSAWDVLWKQGDDESFIALTSLTRRSFNSLLRCFSRHFSYKSGPGKRGRPPKLIEKHRVLDGKNLDVQTPTAAELQNAMFNGWLHAVFVTGCICVKVDGTIAWYKHNVVGSWNDGEISRPFQDKLQREDINLPGYGVVADTAFPVRDGLFQRIISPLKENEIDKFPREVRRSAQQLSSSITSLRQACEWGMGAVTKVYRQLLKSLPYHQIRRGRRIDNIFRLYNYRVRTTGISQIKNHFLS